MVAGQGDEAQSQRTISPANSGQGRALVSDSEEPYLTRALLLAWRSRIPNRSLRRPLQSSTLPREPEQRHTVGRLLRA